MTETAWGSLGSFLSPEGFARPAPSAVLREASLVNEVGRYVVHLRTERKQSRARAYAQRFAHHDNTPVILVPGFMAGDGTLTLMARSLRRQGFRTYRSHIHANVGCTLNASAQLEQRLESIVLRRGRRVQIVGHSLGGLLARAVAARRPDLVAGIVTMGSPMLAPGAHHLSLSTALEALIRLSRAGFPGLMSEECVAGDCARTSFAECRQPLDPSVGFTAIYSQRDGIVDWRACVDDLATQVEVTASHVGMAVDPGVIGEVVAALRRQSPKSMAE